MRKPGRPLSKIPSLVELEEIPGEHFESIEAAQLAALDDLVSDVIDTIRELIASGQLVQVNGRIIPSANR